MRYEGKINKSTSYVLYFQHSQSSRPLPASVLKRNIELNERFFISFVRSSLRYSMPLYIINELFLQIFTCPNTMQYHILCRCYYQDSTFISHILRNTLQIPYNTITIHSNTIKYQSAMCPSS